MFYHIWYDYNGEAIARDIQEVLAIVEDLLLEGTYRIHIEEDN